MRFLLLFLLLFTSDNKKELERFIVNEKTMVFEFKFTDKMRHAYHNHKPIILNFINFRFTKNAYEDNKLNMHVEVVVNGVEMMRITNSNYGRGQDHFANIHHHLWDMGKNKKFNPYKDDIKVAITLKHSTIENLPSKSYAIFDHLALYDFFYEIEN